MSLGHYLRPAWFDEARAIIQGDVFARLLSGRRFEGRVLNAGCGEGLYAPLIESVPKVRLIINFDLAAPSVSKRRPDTRHRDLRASLTALPFGDGIFDAAICSEVIEHISDDRRAASELARVLRPGGILLISVPTPPAPFDPNHVREGYSTQQLGDLLHSVGFNVAASSVCMHWLSRVLYRSWHVAQRIAGRNLFPRFALRAAARVDRVVRIGRPWDLVMIAERRS